MQGIKFVEHKGKEILIAEMSWAKSDQDVLLMLNEVDSIVLNRPKNTVLYLTNMDDGFVSPAAMRYYKDSASNISEHLRGWAFCGLSSIKKMILDLLQKASVVNATPFNSEKEAKDWLITL
jgi:hypothetical protein